MSAALVRQGVPLASVLAAGHEVRKHTEALTELFSALVHTHLRDDDFTSAMDRVRPLAKDVVEAELSMSLDRRIRAEKSDPEAE